MQSPDAVIIGSGAGGSTLAYQLARNGLKTLLVERGGRVRPRPDSGSPPKGHFLYHEVADASQPLSCVGGRTKYYGAALYRFRESDFLEVQHERGVSPAWPIRYGDLAPYYDQAEALYRVHGAAESDFTEPPRDTPFPFPPLPQAPLIEAFATRLQRAGAQISPIPRALDYRAGGPCTMCSTCDAYYCALDAKMDAETAALWAAQATGNLQLASETECLRVLTDASGTRARGVVLRGAEGETIVECPIVVVSAGLPGSALLLRQSRTDRHPEGLGNGSGSLGRYLAGHAVGMVFPILGLKKLGAVHTKDFAINSFYHGATDWRYPLGVIQTGGQTPFWTVAGRLQRPIAKLVGERSITCFYMTEALPTRESGFVFDGDKEGTKTLPTYNLASFAKLRRIAVSLFREAGYVSLARRREPYLWHETGTARMGDDPRTSVVDRDCQVHGISGLYVMDASVLPTAGAVNTGLTIMALALRAGDHMAGRAGRSVAVPAEAVGRA
jgi:choline dehydrogenase-like flavoprotein